MIDPVFFYLFARGLFGLSCGQVDQGRFATQGLAVDDNTEARGGDGFLEQVELVDVICLFEERKVAAIEEMNDFCVGLLSGTWMSLFDSLVIRNNAVLEIFINSQVVLSEKRQQKSI